MTFFNVILYVLAIFKIISFFSDIVSIIAYGFTLENLFRMVIIMCKLAGYAATLIAAAKMDSEKMYVGLRFIFFICIFDIFSVTIGYLNDEFFTSSCLWSCETFSVNWFVAATFSEFSFLEFGLCMAAYAFGRKEA